MSFDVLVRSVLSNKSYNEFVEYTKDWEKYKDGNRLTDLEDISRKCIAFYKDSSRSVEDVMKDIVIYSYSKLISDMKKELSEMGWEINKDRQGGI